MGVAESWVFRVVRLLRGTWWQIARFRRIPGLRIEPGARIWGVVELSQGVLVRQGALILGNVEGRGVSIGARTEIGEYAVLKSFEGAITIGPDCHLGPHSCLYGQGGIEIGAESMLAAGVQIVSFEHEHASTDVPMRKQGNRVRPIAIGDDCWIGAGAVILGGSKLSQGCIAGAGAVVRGEILPYSVCVGVPATRQWSRKKRG